MKSSQSSSTFSLSRSLLFFLSPVYLSKIKKIKIKKLFPKFKEELGTVIIFLFQLLIFLIRFLGGRKAGKYLGGDFFYFLSFYDIEVSTYGKICGSTWFYGSFFFLSFILIFGSLGYRVVTVTDSLTVRNRNTVQWNKNEMCVFILLYFLVWVEKVCMFGVSVFLTD